MGDTAVTILASSYSEFEGISSEFFLATGQTATVRPYYGKLPQSFGAEKFLT